MKLVIYAKEYHALYLKDNGLSYSLRYSPAFLPYSSVTGQLPDLQHGDYNAVCAGW